MFLVLSGMQKQGEEKREKEEEKRKLPSLAALDL